ncbi:hypothetical protein C8Q79DRAFT_1015055 [Trametes meyenii]|nr:hypothetical protein C8Q79DRAFT_1015055 [Trametes meyenii]
MPTAWYVRLGDKKPGKKMPQEPFLSKGGKFAPAFPIFIKVQDKSQADEVLLFQDAIKAIEDAPEVEERVRLAVTLPGHDTILAEYMQDGLKGLYSVAYGTRSAIFLNPQEAAAAATGTPKAIWKKVPTFGRAIAYMISKGDSEKPEGALHREMLNALAGLHISTGEPSKPAKETAGAHHADVNRPPTTPCRSPRPLPLVTPATVPRVRWSQDQRDYVLATPPPPRPVSPPVFESPMFNERLFETPGEVSSAGLPFIYQHVPPSCGPMLDAVLQGFGFDVESKLAIAHACDECSSMGEFVGVMVPQGLTALEAKFMWGLYIDYPPRTEWAGRCLSNYNSQALSDEGLRFLVLMVPGVWHAPKLAVRHEAAVDHCEYHTRLVRQPYKNRTRNKIRRTPTEKKLLVEKRTEARETYANALQAACETITEEAQRVQAEFGGHSDKHYEQQIFQEARAAKQKRKTSKWNAYIMHKLKLLNDALPPGAARFKPGDGTPEVQAISDTWSAMSDEEKDAATSELVKELDERKEMKSLSVQDVPIAALHDTHATLNSSFEDFRRLFAQPDHLMAPMTFATSDRVLDFLQLSLNLSLEEIARRLEAFLLSGVPGVIDWSAQALQDDQTRVGNLILIKFRETTKIKIKKMYYTNFGSRITKKYGVIIENWPLKTFIAPSKMRSRTELDILYNAFSSNATRFRKLTQPEWEQWLTQNSSPEDTVPGEQEDGDEGADTQADANAEKDNEVAADSPTPSQASGTSDTSPLSLSAGSPPGNPLMPTPSTAPSVSSQPSSVAPTGASCMPSPAGKVPIDPALLADTTGSISATITPAPLVLRPTTMNFINTITAQDRSPLVLGVSKPRKRRSDTNQPRGPRKKVPVAPPTPGIPVGSGTSVVLGTIMSEGSSSNGTLSANAGGESNTVATPVDSDSGCGRGRGRGRGRSRRGSRGASGSSRGQGTATTS